MRGRGVPAILLVGVLWLAACDADDITTLQRPAEPVVLTGADLPAIGGVDPDEVVAFAYNRFDGGWRQIPVQVDERHVADLLDVHPGTTRYSLDALVYSDPSTLTGPDPQPSIDLDDEIVFMARAARGRAPSGVEAPAGTVAGSGIELEVSDPLAPGQRGWVYLFRHDGTLDPSAGRDHVEYHFDLLAGDYPEDYDFDGDGDPVGNPPLNPAPPNNPEDSWVRTPWYTEHFADRWITDELRITAGSATGVDILDRNRTHFVNGVCVRTEQTFAAGHGAFIANIDGPVRAIRSYLGANSSAYTERLHVFYDRRQDITTFLRVHPTEEGPDDFLDLAPAAAGMVYRSAVDPDGDVVDGTPDDVTPGFSSWELYDGPQGSLAIAHRVDTDIPNITLSSFRADDTDPTPLPCTGADREWWGAAGPAIAQAMPRTDPTPRGGSGPVFDFTALRTHHYGPPGATADDATRLAAQVGAPLQVSWTYPWNPSP